MGFETKWDIEKGTLIQFRCETGEPKGDEDSVFHYAIRKTDVLDESTNIKELVIEKSKLMIWQHAAFHTIGSKS